MKTSHALLRKSLVSFTSACCLASLLGCAAVSSKVATTTVGDPSNPTGPVTATTLYAVDATTSAIYAFPVGSNGLTAPASTLYPPTGFSARGVATDGSGNIYLGGADVNSVPTVLEYAKGASGTATPISVLNTTAYVSEIESIAVDSSGRIYVIAENAGPLVAVYAAGATGNAVPTRIIADTGDSNLDAFEGTVDASGNLYLATFDLSTYKTGTVVEYSSTANGNVTPIRTISSSTYVLFGIAVDADDNVYVAADNLASQINGAVLEFSSTATGAATPTRTITGSTTGINFGGGLCLDSNDNIFLSNKNPDNGMVGDGYTYNVLSFSSTATGNVAPATTLTSSAIDASNTDTLGLY